MSDLQFLQDLDTISTDLYLHDAAIGVEETAYALFAKQIDSLVSGISLQILSAQ